MYWFDCHDPQSRVENGQPAFLYELPDGVFYGFPQVDSGGLKVARHSGGELVEDPLALDRGLDVHEFEEVRKFVTACLPGVSGTLLRHETCMYTMSPDGHFLIDRHPLYPGLAFAAGLSGHGFKFVPALGEALVQMVLGEETTSPVGFLSLQRYRSMRS
jgi:glycine/D-amino acid oxidase-like deaminating enzyme